MRAQPLGLRSGDRELLESWTRSSSIRAGLAQRARIVLLAADGVSNTEIAERVGVSRPTVISWRDRYASSGLKGLGDEQRPGRPRTVDRARILAATLTPPPARLGITHWSSRLLADHLNVDASTVLRTWRHHRVQPWRAETFKFSTDPELIAKVSDVVGLYLNPPENAIVLSIDEKSQIQALDRRNTRCRCNPGRPRNALMTTCGAAPPNAALWAAMGGRRGDRCALRAADLDRLRLPCCEQLVHGAAAQPDHVGRLGGGSHEWFHDHVPFPAWSGSSAGAD